MPRRKLFVDQIARGKVPADPHAAKTISSAHAAKQAFEHLHKSLPEPRGKAVGRDRMQGATAERMLERIRQSVPRTLEQLEMRARRSSVTSRKPHWFVVWSGSKGKTGMTSYPMKRMPAEDLFLRTHRGVTDYRMFGAD